MAAARGPRRRAMDRKNLDFLSPSFREGLAPQIIGVTFIERIARGYICL